MDLLLESCEFLPEKGVAASVLGAGARALRETANNRTTSRSQPATRRPAAGKQSEGFHFAAPGTAEASGHHPRNGTCWWKAGDGEGEGIEGNLSPVDRTTAVERFDGRILLCPQESYQLMYAIRASGVAGVGRGSAESLSRDGGFEEGTHTLGQVRHRLLSDEPASQPVSLEREILPPSLLVCFFGTARVLKTSPPLSLKLPNTTRLQDARRFSTRWSTAQEKHTLAHDFIGQMASKSDSFAFWHFLPLSAFIEGQTVFPPLVLAPVDPRWP